MPNDRWLSGIFLGRQWRTEPAQIALAWLYSKLAVTAPIIGATKRGHLEAAIGALDVTLTPEEIQKIESAYLPHPIRGFDV